MSADRTNITTTDGRSPEEVRDEQEAEGPLSGQHKSYIVLTEEERAKGFVRSVRDSYKHSRCGRVTKMGPSLAETYARDPGFYGATMCVHCGGHYPVGVGGEFDWLDGEKVGS